MKCVTECRNHGIHGVPTRSFTKADHGAGASESQRDYSGEYVTRVLAEFMPAGEATVKWCLHRERAVSASVLCFLILWRPHSFQKC